MSKKLRLGRAGAMFLAIPAMLGIAALCPARDGRTSATLSNGIRDHGRGAAPGKFRLRLERPIVVGGADPAVSVRYVLENLSTRDVISLGIRYAPHRFARITLLESGRAVPRKWTLSQLGGGPCNVRLIEPGREYAATVRLGELYDLSRPGTYTLKVATTFDTLAVEDGVCNSEDVVVASNEVTFKVE